MPLKRRKEAEEPKNEGGEELSKQDIQREVREVFAEERERGKFSQILGELKEKVVGDMARLEELFCTPDGKVCFATESQLREYMEAQKKKIEELNAKISQVANQIKVLGESKGEAPVVTSLKPAKDFEKMTVEEQNAYLNELDEMGLSHSAAYALVKRCGTSNRPRNERCDMLAKSLKEYPAQEIFEKLPENKRDQVVSIFCEDGVCRAKLKKGGYALVKREKNGKWRFFDPEVEAQFPRI